MIVVVNSSPLIALSRIKKLTLLKTLFNEIQIPSAVYEEVVIQGRGRCGTNEIESAKWIKTKEIKNKSHVNYLLETLDEGEAEVLILAEELNADWAIIDEPKARISAVLIGLKVIGTVGIILLAKELCVIKNVKHILDSLRKNNFRISDNICKWALHEAGE